MYAKYIPNSNYIAATRCTTLMNGRELMIPLQSVKYKTRAGPVEHRRDKTGSDVVFVRGLIRRVGTDSHDRSEEVR